MNLSTAIQSACRAAADAYDFAALGLTVDAIFGRSRQEPIASARIAAVAACIDGLTVSQEALGQRFGRQHTTVSNSRYRAKDRIDIGDRVFAGAYRNARAALAAAYDTPAAPPSSSAPQPPEAIASAGSAPAPQPPEAMRRGTLPPLPHRAGSAPAWVAM